MPQREIGDRQLKLDQQLEKQSNVRQLSYLTDEQSAENVLRTRCFAFGDRMEKEAAPQQQSPAACVKSAAAIIYPAVADSVDLPDFLFRKNKDEDAFVLLTIAEQQPLLEKNTAIAENVKSLDDLRLKTLLVPMWPEIADLNISIHIISRRSTLLKITIDGINAVVEAHWNLFIPYLDQIKRLPIVHPEILDIFAKAVFNYIALIMKHPYLPKNKARGLVIDAYRVQPEFLLASLDIFNKPNVYHIHSTRIWLKRISKANDRLHLQIDASALADAPLVTPEFVEELISFIHKIVKNYAFRYADYLWTQRYKIISDNHPGAGMVVIDGKDIIINIQSLISKANWKPTISLILGYAVIFAILQSLERYDKEINMYLALSKTWTRYLSFDDSIEQQSVREVCGLSESHETEQYRRLSACMIGREILDRIDDFIALMNYCAKETFVERLKVLNESSYRRKSGVFLEQSWCKVQNLNTALMRHNINYGKLIEVLRNDNIDHLQLADFLRTGRLGNTDVVDVSEWLSLRTLLYDLINAPKVFRNDYQMLLKVLTKVNKGLLVYVWRLGIDKDVRYEIVSGYLAKLMIGIFMFDRVKIYEIVSDPVECLEAEALTGYLLNWASFTPEKRRSITEGMLSGLPHSVVAQFRVQTASDVDKLVPVMKIRASGLIGFYLHQVYRWGSTQDELTERIRSYFPELLKQAQRSILPAETSRGGAMLLLLLAQIISDERDGFARHIVITEEERRIVRDLFKRCIDWDQRHFVMMVAGIAAGYMGTIDAWILRQFDTLLARYDGGDRMVLRSVVQFDVGNLIERALLTARKGEEGSLLSNIQLLRFGVDPIISDQANKILNAMASQCGIQSPEVILKGKDIRELVLALSRRSKV